MQCLFINRIISYTSRFYDDSLPPNKMHRDAICLQDSADAMRAAKDVARALCEHTESNDAGASTTGTYAPGPFELELVSQPSCVPGPFRHS